MDMKASIITTATCLAFLVSVSHASIKKIQFMKSPNGISEATLHNLTLATTHATDEVQCGRKCMYMGGCRAFHVHRCSPLCNCTLLSLAPNSLTGGEKQLYIATIMPPPEASCCNEIGRNKGARAFDLTPANKHPITKIRLFHRSDNETFDETLVGLEVTYGDEIQIAGRVGGTALISECILGNGEYVHTVKYRLRGGPTVDTISLVTSEKTCNSFGNTDSQLTGYNLLHISGIVGSWFDQLIFAFESC